MFDYDRDIIQPPEEREELALASTSMLDVGGTDMWVMKYDSGTTRRNRQLASRVYASWN